MIRKAGKDDVEMISASYQELFSYEAEHGNQTNWVPGLYPSENTARTAFENETLYVLEEGGVFCGSMILNHIQPAEYGKIDWHYAAEPDEVLVLHTLCVPPSQKSKGYGRRMVAFTVDRAQKLGCKAVRLDTWEGNSPAAALYESMGFRLAGSAPMCLQGLIPEQQIFFEREVGKTE